MGGRIVKPPTCVKRRCAKRADAEGGENGGMATIACTCLPTTFICGWHIYMYYVLCRPYLGLQALCRPYLGLQPLQSALLFWRVAAALSCGRLRKGRDLSVRLFVYIYYILYAHMPVYLCVQLFVSRHYQAYVSPTLLLKWQQQGQS